MSTLADRLRRAREHKGLNLRQLAKLAEIDHTYISRLETGGRTNVSLMQAKRLCEELGVSLDWLAGIRKSVEHLDMLEKSA